MTNPARPWVRPARAQDEAFIAGHIEDSRRESSRYRGRRKEQIASGGASIRLVAGIGDTVMGSIVAVETDPGKWEISHVHVTEGARGVGIGDLLMVACLDAARSLGGDWCSGSALPGDRATKNLFERHGLVAQTILVGVPLSGPSS